MKTAHTYYCCVASLLALIFLGLAWELWLAPLRPGGSFMVFKIFPLLALLPGVLRGRIYVYQCASMLVLAFFVEGVVRGYSDGGISATLAAIEVLLAVIFFSASIGYVRAARTASR